MCLIGITSYYNSNVKNWFFNGHRRVCEIIQYNDPNNDLLILKILILIHVATPTHSCADFCLISFVQISIWWERYLQRSSFAAPQDIKQCCMYLRIHMPIFLCSLFKDLSCVSVFCLHVCMCTNSRLPDVDRCQKRSDKSPGTALWVFVKPHGCWEWNPGPPQEQQVFPHPNSNHPN